MCTRVVLGWEGDTLLTPGDGNEVKCVAHLHGGMELLVAGMAGNKAGWQGQPRHIPKWLVVKL